MTTPSVDNHTTTGTNRVASHPRAADATAIDNSPQGISQLIEDQISGDVDQYVEHTSGLNWRIANHGPAMTEEQLQTAIDEFVEGQGSAWSTDLDAYQSQVVDGGTQLLQRLGSEDVRGLSQAEREEILAMILNDDDPQAQIAILTALSQPGAVDAATLDAAIGFFADVDIATQSPELADALAQARLQHVGEQMQAVNPADPTTVDAARAAIGDLRDSDYARMLGLDGPEFNAAMDAMLETIPAAGMSQDDVEAAMENFADAADQLDLVAGNDSTTIGLRLLAMQGGAIGLEEAGGGILPDDPVDALELLSTGVRMPVSASRFLIERGMVQAADGSFGSALASQGLKRVLGSIGIGLAGVQFIREIRGGDYAQAATTGIGIAGLALGAFGTTSWAGPVGIALGVIAFGASVGLGQWRNVQASNQYMNDTSAEFLAHAGFAPDVADALSDQSSQGLSPVPFLFAYGESMGLDREQTVDWLNSLDPDDLASIRNRAHYALDDVSGDLSQLDGPADPEVVQFLSEYQEARADGYGWDYGNRFNLSPEQSRVVVANNWDEFTAILSAKGLTPPAPPVVDGDGSARPMPMDLATATDLLLANYDDIRSSDNIRQEDLARLRDDVDADLELRWAAEFLLNSKSSRSLLDVGQGRGSVDGHISRKDLEQAQELIASGDYLVELLDTANGEGGRDSNIADQDFSAALYDPAISPEIRAQIEAMLEERQGS